MRTILYLASSSTRLCAVQVLADAGRSLLTERHLPELPDSPAWYLMTLMTKTDADLDGADCLGGAVMKVS